MSAYSAMQLKYSLRLKVVYNLQLINLCHMTAIFGCKISLMIFDVNALSIIYSLKKRSLDILASLLHL